MSSERVPPAPAESEAALPEPLLVALGALQLVDPQALAAEAGTFTRAEMTAGAAAAGSPAPAGALTEHGDMLTHLLQMGVAVVSTGVRLANNEGTGWHFPQPILDAKLAARHVQANRTDLNHTKRFAMGHSSGGHISIAAQIGRNLTDNGAGIDLTLNGNGQTFSTTSTNVPADAEGVGLSEAARGALGHRLLHQGVVGRERVQRVAQRVRGGWHQELQLHVPLAARQVQRRGGANQIKSSIQAI